MLCKIGRLLSFEATAAQKQALICSRMPVDLPRAIEGFCRQAVKHDDYRLQAIKAAAVAAAAPSTNAGCTAQRTMDACGAAGEQGANNSLPSWTC